LQQFDETPQRAIVRAIALGTLRWYLRLAPAIEILVSEPSRLDRAVRALLIAAAHQIEYSRNAPQATVHTAVDATRILDLGRASSLVNAVLRRFVSERPSVQLDRNVAVRTAHPQWLVDRLAQAWPESFESILAANNVHPPLVLRVDLTRGDVPSYLKQLEVAGHTGTPIEWAPAAVRLDQPVPVSALPGFNTGAVSVQDAGAQLAAPLLDARPRMRVLDACAAPGGKTGHVLEYTPQLGELTAVDLNPARVARIQENLGRLGRDARVVAADFREPQGFWDGRPFDRVLLDVPCSSTGVIRRHPDIKLLRRPSDIESFAATQEQLLRAAFHVLTPGGRLLYATCSLLPAENEEVVARLLASEPRARLAAMPPAAQLAPGAVDRPIGIQLLPGAQAGSDGFYYACVEKTTAGT
jgi:16S rRNA (cytosine967-C5)-methyltransferase